MIDLEAPHEPDKKHVFVKRYPTAGAVERVFTDFYKLKTAGVQVLHEPVAFNQNQEGWGVVSKASLLTTTAEVVRAVKSLNDQSAYLAFVDALIRVDLEQLFKFVSAMGQPHDESRRAQVLHQYRQKLATIPEDLSIASGVDWTENERRLFITSLDPFDDLELWPGAVFSPKIDNKIFNHGLRLGRLTANDADVKPIVYSPMSQLRRFILSSFDRKKTLPAPSSYPDFFAGLNPAEKVQFRAIANDAMSLSGIEDGNELYKQICNSLTPQQLNKYGLSNKTHRYGLNTRQRNQRDQHDINARQQDPNDVSIQSGKYGIIAEQRDPFIYAETKKRFALLEYDGSPCVIWEDVSHTIGAPGLVPMHLRPQYMALAVQHLLRLDPSLDKASLWPGMLQAFVLKDLRKLQVTELYMLANLRGSPQDRETSHKAYEDEWRDYAVLSQREAYAAIVLASECPEGPFDEQLKILTQVYSGNNPRVSLRNPGISLASPLNGYAKSIRGQITSVERLLEHPPERKRLEELARGSYPH